MCIISTTGTFRVVVLNIRNTKKKNNGKKTPESSLNPLPMRQSVRQRHVCRGLNVIVYRVLQTHRNTHADTHVRARDTPTNRKKKKPGQIRQTNKREDTIPYLIFRVQLVQH